MMRSSYRCVLVLLAASGMALADFSMEQTSQVTGGALAGMLKMAARFSKQGSGPQTSTVAVKGDRLVHINAGRASIIDLGKETITDIDFQKKTYSVMTFAEMAQMLQQASEKMHENQARENQAQMNFKVSVNPTGQTRQINGVEAKETILKMEMEVTDPQKGQSGTMTVTTDMWLAPKAPGYDELQAFYKRMAEKLNWMPGSNPMLASRPDMVKGMQEMMKRASAMDGMPVLQVTNMGGAGAPGSQAGSEGAAPQQQQQAQAPKPSAEESVAGALAGRLGRFGGFGRKKKPAQEQQAAENSQPAGTPQQAQQAGSLIEITVGTSNFSNAAVDAGKFEVPAGFTQVERKQR